MTTDRLDRMDRRARFSVGGAVLFVGVLLLVLGWYLISGQALAAKQLPYLASASLSGAVLVVCGFLFMVSGGSGVDAEAVRRMAELHALLTEAVGEAGGTAEESGESGNPEDYAASNGSRDAEASESSPGTSSGFQGTITSSPAVSDV